MTAHKLDVEGYLQREKELAEIVQVDDTHIVIQIPGEHLDGEYEIALVSCKTPEQVVGWIYQLSEKQWVTRDILRRFIEVASAKAGIEL
ncbi:MULTISPECIES: hypothetical protein [Klebsiella]|uniref:hypothetical protein n=1 Tax=Klebsiella TaxID=570 RepID=UPI00191B4F89|nr:MULTISPECIES: hypothetical protein [Klebsiella]MDS7892835.1 hypothetical protein [Klebsiella michiganensis]CAA0273248.1 Uncharacterised protein [Klebsiella oxytoca]HDY3609276.1 hypothetical protein [Klebsiella michiganensis]